MATSRLNNRARQGPSPKEATVSKKPKEELKALEEFESNLRPLLNRIHRTKCRTILTVKGEPAFVVMDVATYDLLRSSVKLGLLLGEGEADLRMGRTIPMEKVFRELCRGKKLSD